MRREFGQIDLPTLLSPRRAGSGREGPCRRRREIPAARRRGRRSAAASRRPAARDQPGHLRSHEIGAPARGQGIARPRFRMGAADPVERRPRPHRHCFRRPSARPRSRAARARPRPAACSRTRRKAIRISIMFYRSLQSYRQALADSAPVLLLTPDADFLKALKSGPPEARQPRRTRNEALLNRKISHGRGRRRYLLLESSCRSCSSTCCCPATMRW